MSAYGSSSVVVSGERWRRLLALAQARGDRLAVATLEARLQGHARLALNDRRIAQLLAQRLIIDA